MPNYNWHVIRYPASIACWDYHTTFTFGTNPECGSIHFVRILKHGLNGLVVWCNVHYVSNYQIQFDFDGTHAKNSVERIHYRNFNLNFNYIIGVNHIHRWMEAAGTSDLRCVDNAALRVCASRRP